MKKNGFTLVELLGVIVILAIILVFAVPKILSVIDSSRQNIYKSDVNTIVEEINYIYENTMSLNEPEYKLYDFDSLTQKQEEALTFKGDKPSSGIIRINETEGQFESIVVTNLISSDGKWCANKSANSKDITVSKASDCN